jgi:hypothetical protein
MREVRLSFNYIVLVVIMELIGFIKRPAIQNEEKKKSTIKIIG